MPVKTDSAGSGAGGTAVSVVVPVYNDADLLPRCLAGIAAQTVPVDRVVVVDDCGHDDSVAVAERELRRHGLAHEVVRHDHNLGLGAARNDGLARCTGEWVWFLDADDSAEPGMLAALLDAAAEYGTDVACCRTRRTTPEGREVDVTEPPFGAPVVTGREAARMLLGNRMRAYACNKLFRRTTLPARPWDEGRRYEDFAPMLRLFLASDLVALVDAPLFRYTINPGSLSRRFTPATFDLLSVGEEVSRMLADEPGLAADHRVYRYLNVVIPLANMALRAEHAGGDAELTRAAVAAARAAVRLGELPWLAVGGHPGLAARAALLKGAPRVYSYGLARR